MGGGKGVPNHDERSHSREQSYPCVQAGIEGVEAQVREPFETDPGAQRGQYGTPARQLIVSQSERPLVDDQ